MPPAEDRVARLAADVGGQERQRRVTEPPTVGHQPQHPLLMQRQIGDVARNGVGGDPALHRIAQASCRERQHRGETTGRAGQRGVWRGERIGLRRLR
jgi:hypothetical protein